MEQKRNEALRLYLTQGKTQREIAQLIGVSERTIYSWIQKYAWDKLRYASYQGPAMIAENLCNQLVELQKAIDRREPGARYPTKDESQIIHRLICDIEKMRKFPSMGVTMQVLATFRNHVSKCDKDLANKLSGYLMTYTEQKATSALYPLANDYDNEKVSPIYPGSEQDTDYTRYYQYRLPEDEEPEENCNVKSEEEHPEPAEIAENQTVVTTPTPSQPAETGSESEADMDEEIEKILRTDLVTALTPRKDVDDRAKLLHRWDTFVQAQNRPDSSAPPNK